jgi:hypothetical protein
VKFDWKHWALFFGAPMATAFVDYLVNTGVSKATVERAALSMVLVGIALAKQSFLTPAVKS